MPVRYRRLRPGELGQRRLELRRSHVGPDEAAQLDRGVGLLADLVLEGELFRLVHHVHTATADVELPAVVDAPQPALLVAAEEQRGAAVGTELVEQADAAAGVAERDEVLAEQAHAHGRAIGLRQLPAEQRRQPVAAHRGAHGGGVADAGQ